MYIYIVYTQRFLVSDSACKQTKFARNASELFMSAIPYAFVAIH